IQQRGLFLEAAVDRHHFSCDAAWNDDAAAVLLQAEERLAGGDLVSRVGHDNAANGADGVRDEWVSANFQAAGGVGPEPRVHVGKMNTFRHLPQHFTADGCITCRPLGGARCMPCVPLLYPQVGQDQAYEHECYEDCDHDEPPEIFVSRPCESGSGALAKHFFHELIPIGFRNQAEYVCDRMSAILQVG